jgi:ankyrin repeat protein
LPEADGVDAAAEVVALGLPLDPCAKDSKSRQPLHLATAGAHDTVVQWLLERGCSPLAEDADKKTPIVLATALVASGVANALLARIQAYLATASSPPESAPGPPRLLTEQDARRLAGGVEGAMLPSLLAPGCGATAESVFVHWATPAPAPAASPVLEYQVQWQPKKGLSLTWHTATLQMVAHTPGSAAAPAATAGSSKSNSGSSHSSSSGSILLDSIGATPSSDSVQQQPQQQWIVLDKASAAKTVSIIQAPATAHSYACVVGLQPSTVYSLRVRARNANGWGPWSARSDDICTAAAAPASAAASGSAEAEGGSAPTALSALSYAALAQNVAALFTGGSFSASAAPSAVQSALSSPMFTGLSAAAAPAGSSFSTPLLDPAAHALGGSGGAMPAYTLGDPASGGATPSTPSRAPGQRQGSAAQSPFTNPASQGLLLPPAAVSAIAAGDVAALRSLQPSLSGAFTDAQGRTALALASQGGHLRVASWLLTERLCDVNAHDKFHATPLLYAVVQGSLPMVKLLVLHGANVNAADVKGYTALHYAITKGRVALFRWLCEVGADVDARTARNESLRDLLEERIAHIGPGGREDLLAARQMLVLLDSARSVPVVSQSPSMVDVTKSSVLLFLPHPQPVPGCPTPLFYEVQYSRKLALFWSTASDCVVVGTDMFADAPLAASAVAAGFLPSTAAPGSIAGGVASVPPSPVSSARLRPSQSPPKPPAFTLGMASAPSTPGRMGSRGSRADADDSSPFPAAVHSLSGPDADARVKVLQYLATGILVVVSDLSPDNKYMFQSRLRNARGWSQWSPRSVEIPTRGETDMHQLPPLLTMAAGAFNYSETNWDMTLPSTWQSILRLSSKLLGEIVARLEIPLPAPLGVGVAYPSTPIKTPRAITSTSLTMQQSQQQTAVFDALSGAVPTTASKIDIRLAFDAAAPSHNEEDNNRDTQGRRPVQETLETARQDAMENLVSDQTVALCRDFFLQAVKSLETTGDLASMVLTASSDSFLVTTLYEVIASSKGRYADDIRWTPESVLSAYAGVAMDAAANANTPAIGWLCGITQDPALDMLNVPSSALRLLDSIVRVADADGRGLLHAAVVSDDTRFLGWLFNQFSQGGASLMDVASASFSRKSRASVAHLAAYSGSLDVLGWLFSQGLLGADDKDVNGWCCLFYAAAGMSPYLTMRFLLASDLLKPLSVTGVDDKGRTIAHMAAANSSGDSQLMGLLHSKNSKLLYQEDRDGKTPLEFAILARNAGAVGWLMVHAGHTPSEFLLQQAAAVLPVVGRTDGHTHVA